MKKILSLFLVLMVALPTLLSCERQQTDVESEVSSISSVSSDSSSSIEKLLPLPEDSIRLGYLVNGIDQLSSYITLKADGTFEGSCDKYVYESSDSILWECLYKNSYTGTFVNIEKINEYSYKMDLTDLITEHPIGEDITDGRIETIASEPYGLTGGTEFILYLPSTPVNTLPKEFLDYWPYRFFERTRAKDTLSCYAIHNVATNEGFFHISLE